MAKAKYRLQALLEVKNRVKQRATAILAKSIFKLKEEEERKKELVTEKEKIIEEWTICQKEMDAHMQSGGLVRKGNTHLNFLKKLKEDEEAKAKEIVAQEGVVKKAKETVSRARRDYIDACKEYNILEKHKELWEKKTKKEMSLQEEKEFDELSHTIHQIRKWSADQQENERS